MKRRTQVLSLVAGVLALAIAAWIWKGGETPKDSPIEKTIARDFKLVSHSKDDFSDRHSYRRGDEDLELEIITGLDAESAKLLIDDGVMGIHALYADALSAYPENLSRQIKTPERFQPVLTQKEINGMPCTIFSLYATDRRTYGALSDDTAKLRSLLAWVYIQPKEMVYKIRLFAPLAVSPDQIQQQFERLLTP